jgi:tRNA dimethylallyltransferase
VIAIVGPTASGKSHAALQLAQRLGGEIIVCDSMQVYRHFDIGTAKPTREERERVPHHLVDLVEPDVIFSAAQFAAAADIAIADIVARGRVPIIVGGTGLYLRALRFGLFAGPAKDTALRERLYALEHAAPGTLHARLAALDPQTAARLHKNDALRLVRALEVYESTGTTIGDHHAAHNPIERHALRVLLLDPPNDLLRDRIAARTRAMLAAGWLAETTALYARYGADINGLTAVGYRQIVDTLAGRAPRDALERAIVAATWQYAKRQRTWFRKEPGVSTYASAEQLLQAV